MKPNNTEVKDDMLLYNPNSRAYSLIMLGAAATTLSNIWVLRAMDSDNMGYLAGYFVIGTILNLLFMFYTAIKVKVYDKRWTYLGFGYSGFMTLRLLIFPKGLSNDVYLFALIFGIIAITLLVLGNLIGYKNIIKREQYIEKKDINIKELFN